MLQCERCSHLFPQDENWAQVIRHGVPPERIKQIWLCEGCHQDLITFVGIRPDTPELWERKENPDVEVPVKPFSLCADERLELS